jgi:hypothetical protein
MILASACVQHVPADAMPVRLDCSLLSFAQTLDCRLLAGQVLGVDSLNIQILCRGCIANSTGPPHSPDKVSIHEASQQHTHMKALWRMRLVHCRSLCLHPQRTLSSTCTCRVHPHVWSRDPPAPPPQSADCARSKRCCVQLPGQQPCKSSDQPTDVGRSPRSRQIEQPRRRLGR